MSFRSLLLSTAILQQKDTAAGGAGDITPTYTTLGAFKCNIEPVPSQTRLEYAKAERSTDHTIDAETRQAFTPHLAELIRRTPKAFRIVFSDPQSRRTRYFLVDGAWDEQQRNRQTVIEATETDSGSHNN